MAATGTHRPDVTKVQGDLRRQVDDLVGRIGYPLVPEAMYNRVLDGAVELTGADAGSMILVDEETRLLNIPATKGFSESTVQNLNISIGEGIIGWVVQEAQPLIVPDTSQEPRFIAGDLDVRSELAVPVLLGDQVIGALDVNGMRPGAFSDAHCEALVAFATTMAPRVQNARLFGETSQRADALDALFEIGKLVSQTLDINRLLERIVEHAVSIMRARLAAVTLLDDEEEHLATRAVAGTSTEYGRKPPLPVGESLIGDVVLSKRPEIVEDVGSDPRYRFKDVAARAGLRSLLAVPLMFRDKVFGVLSIYHGHFHVFKSEEIHMTMSLADQAAIALRNARLYEQMMTLEEQVRRLEKLGTAGQIAIGLTHELRNPLTVVKVLLDSTIDLTLEDRVVIQSEVNRMGAIVEQYLGYARPKETAWGAVAVQRVISTSVRLLELRASRQEVDVVLDLDSGPDYIIGNENQLEQVFVNLFLNAMDAMPNGGTLTVSTRLTGSDVEIQVCDTGTGIPEQVMERLFEPFNTSKETGIGLGLSIVRRIVRDHQGDIEVTSNEGEHTQFTIVLPVVDPDEELGQPTVSLGETT